MGRISIYQAKNSSKDDFELFTFTDNDNYMKNLRNYILDVIKEDYEDYSNLTNPSEKDIMNHFVERFESEFNHDYNKRMYPRIHRRIENYLLGLAYNFAYTYYEQTEQAMEFHNINLKDKRDIEYVKRNLFDWVSSSNGNGSNFSNYYFQMITQEIIKLLNKHKLYTEKLSL